MTAAQPLTPEVAQVITTLRRAVQELVAAYAPVLEQATAVLRKVQAALPPGEVFALQDALRRRGGKRAAALKGLVQALLSHGARLKKTPHGRALLQRLLLAATLLLMGLLAQRAGEQEAEIPPRRPASWEEEPPPPKPIEIFLKKTLMPFAP